MKTTKHTTAGSDGMSYEEMPLPPKIKRQRFNPIKAYFKAMLEVILA